MRYSQRVNYLLSTEEIRKKIETLIITNVAEVIGKHVQKTEGRRYVVSGNNEVITVTFPTNKEKELWKSKQTQ